MTLSKLFNTAKLNYHSSCFQAIAATSATNPVPNPFTKPFLLQWRASRPLLKQRRKPAVKKILREIPLPGVLEVGDREKVEATLKHLMLNRQYSAGYVIFRHYYQFLPEDEVEKRRRLLRDLKYVRDVMFDAKRKKLKHKKIERVRASKRSKMNAKKVARFGRIGRLRTLDYPNRMSKFPLTLDVLQHVILYGKKDPRLALTYMSNAKLLFGDALSHHVGTQTNYAKVLMYFNEYTSAFQVLNRLLQLKVVDFDLLSPRIVSTLGEDYIHTLSSIILGSTINFNYQPEFVANAQKLFSFILDEQNGVKLETIPRITIQLVSHFLDSIASGSVKDLFEFCKEHSELLRRDNYTLRRREKFFLLQSLIQGAKAEGINFSFLSELNSDFEQAFYAVRDHPATLQLPHTDPLPSVKRPKMSAVDILKSRGINIFHTMYRNQTRPPEKGTRRQRAKRRSRIFREKLLSGEIQPRRKVIVQNKDSSAKSEGKKTEGKKTEGKKVTENVTLQK